jgi:DNA polymerase-4
LFEDVQEREKLSHAVDGINQKFGKNTVFLASVEKTKDHADEKIAFNKTWLFSEGKGDNEWPDAFAGTEDEG